jgi:hypothetical protein
MFTQTWKKYVPVIAILLKRSVNGEQTLKLNHTDFERAAGGRKIKFSFNNLELNNGRMNSLAKHTPIVKELAQVLQEHELTRGLIRNQNLEFMMNNDFELLIKNHTAQVKDALPQEITE